MKNILLSCLLVFVIAGCSTETQKKKQEPINIFDKKLECAKFIPQEKKRKNEWQEYQDNLSSIKKDEDRLAFSLITVVYSEKMDTCLSLFRKNIDITEGEYSTYIKSLNVTDILTNETVFNERCYYNEKSDKEDYTGTDLFSEKYSPCLELIEAKFKNFTQNK